MSARLTQWISLGLVLAALAVSAALYGDLPSQVATHFNAAGEPDGWSDRPTAALMMPAIMAGLWLMLWVLPKISPQGWRVEPFADVWSRCQLAIIAFMLLVHVGVLGHAVGWWGADLGGMVMIGVGLLFATLGNYLGKTTRNFFLGIRTPWTLASDEVWRRTHRLGGWLMVGAGVALMVMGFTGVHELAIAVVIGVAVLVPAIYSFFAYRSIEGFKPPPDH
ncbi:MAG TPA: SdpI family protein [Gammaproteobacteria bacterium]|nr:SdpI family protein [Gammaproteobacteria bacterium]